MKAFLLAAGEGKRLRPLTAAIPKCLVPIDGVPLLQIWLELCRRHGIDDVLVNVHYLADHVLEFLTRQNSGVRVTSVFEPSLLGSAGTVVENADFVKGEESFFILYADNLTDLDLTDMFQFHRRHPGLVTMAVQPTDTPKQKGIVTLDDNDRVLEFEEKPSSPKSNLMNAGIYVTSQGVVDRLRELRTADTPFDFGHHVLPELIGSIDAYRVSGYLADIGSPESYEKAQREWAIRRP